MMTTSFTLDLTDTIATSGSQTSSGEHCTYTTARARLTGAYSLYMTANEEVLAGNPCASSTRKRDQLVGDLSVSEDDNLQSFVEGVSSFIGWP